MWADADVDVGIWLGRLRMEGLCIGVAVIVGVGFLGRSGSGRLFMHRESVCFCVCVIRGEGGLIVWLCMKVCCIYM